jgi:hypothetical protein
MESGPIQFTAAGLSLVVAAIWSSVMGVLFFVMVGLFICDVLLGSLRAISTGGFEGWSKERFQRGLAKFLAALVGVVLSALADILLQDMGLGGEGALLTSGLLGFMCLGFLVSAARNLSYFFPFVEAWTAALLRKVRDPNEIPKRRSSDRGTSEE